MAYTLIFKPGAKRQYDRLNANLKHRIAPHIDALEQDPRPLGCLKLRGDENVYRIRVGDYRILYEVQDEVLLILVLKIAHRSDVYR